MLSKMLPDKDARLELAEDKELAMYMLLCLPYLSYFLVERIMDILIDVSDNDIEKLACIHQSIEEILQYPSRSAILLDAQVAYVSFF
jgi:hypothetical protein